MPFSGGRRGPRWRGPEQQCRDHGTGDNGTLFYGPLERAESGKATHAAHNEATVATRAKKAMRPIPLPAATTALMAKMAAVTSQKPAGADRRWSNTAKSVQGAELLAAESRSTASLGPDRALGRGRASRTHTPRRCREDRKGFTVRRSRAVPGRCRCA